jgi:hypothetical protein
MRYLKNLGLAGMPGPRVSKLHDLLRRSSSYWAMGWGIMVGLAFLAAATISFVLSGAPTQ